MDSKIIYKKILDQLFNDCHISNIQIGQSWVITSLEDGRIGMAAKMFEQISTPLNEVARLYPSAHELANQIYSKDAFLSTLALSAVNACNNSLDYIRTNHLEYEKDDICTKELSLDNKTVGIIGHMKRTYDQMNDYYALKKIYMFDLDETKGDYPPESEPVLLPECDVVIITATTLINHTLSEIITWSPNAYRILYGPSAPFVETIPGIDRICGYSISDPVSASDWNENHSGSPLSFCEPFKVDTNN